MTDFSKGHTPKLIFNFALPMLIGNMCQQMYQIIDTIIVGQTIGKQALAAVGASAPIIFVLVSLVIGVTSGFTIIIAQFFGAKQYDNIIRAKDTMNIMMVSTAILISIISIVFSELLFKILNIPKEIIGTATQYFDIYVGGMIFTFIMHCSANVMRGLGNSKTPLKFMVFSCILNVILDLLFILVFNWGIKGVAWATVLSQFTVVLGLFHHCKKHIPLIKFNFINPIFDINLMKKSIKIGLPGGIQQTIIALSNMVLTSLVAGFGTDVLAAYTAAGRTENIAMMPAMSFGAALSAFSGQNIGAKRPHRVRQGLRATLIISSTISIACTIIFIVFGRYIMNAFTSGTETAVIEYGYKYLVITGVFYIFFSAMFSYAGVIRASGDTFVLMLIALVSQVVIRIPLAYLFANQFGPLGIWWSIPSSWILGWFGNFIYYRSGRWKRRKLIQEYPLITD